MLFKLRHEYVLSFLPLECLCSVNQLRRVHLICDGVRLRSVVPIQIMKTDHEGEQDEEEEDKETSDVPHHPPERDLKRTENFERRHQVRGSSYADDVGNRE